MAHAAAHGYPVPEVFEIGQNALVLERIEGATMLDDLWRRPWRLSAHAGTLARLHRQLHEMLAPADLGDGRLLHMDLHPENVMLSPRGPVVIDWTNARAGDPRWTWR
jgi:tRNA A-37 threonylcarbamoyl transferase component Bud32